jgi:hypothetical protein
MPASGNARSRFVLVEVEIVIAAIPGTGLIGFSAT